MFYNDYHFAGMHLVWWLLWGAYFVWIFATPFYVPNQLKRRDTAVDILQKRFASGEISKSDYLEHRKLLSSNLR